MLRTTNIALCTLAMLAAMLAVPFSQSVQAQTDSGLSLLSEFIIPASNSVKNPHVVAANGQVTVSGNANEQSAYVWTKAAAANTFGTPVDLGPAEGSPDWSTTSIAIGPDGSTWVTWINQDSRTIYLRQRTPAGQWGPRRTVEGGGEFHVNVEITVASNNQIFVFWRDVDRPIRYRFSTDGGENWSSRRDVVGEVAYRGAFGAASGPNGQVGVAFNGGANDKLQVFVGLWNGTSFTTTRVTPGGADYADATITFTPAGTPYVAWRGVASSGGNAGAFFSERQANGSWPVSRVVGGKVDTNVSINSDEAGNLHMTWVGEPSGGRSIYYAFKPAGDAFRGPIASSDSGTLFNPRVAGNTGDATYGHSVVEEFSGSRVVTRYSLFGSNVIAFGGEPVVNDGAARVAPAADGTVKLSFRNVRGSPNQVRWRWGAAPTDGQSDSNNWQSVGSELRIAVPEAVRNSTSCQPTTLYTQLRNSTTNLVEAQARPVTVNLDGVVEANAYLDNPFTKGSPQLLQESAELAAVAGAPGGAPNYTRVPLTWVNIVAETDCSGITSAGIGASVDKIEQTLLIQNESYQGLVTLPDLANLKPGPVPFVVRVTDGTGNVRVFNLQVILDEEKPVLNGGTVTASGAPGGDIIQELSFQDINVTDSQYPGGFWGVWIANAPEAVADPLTDASLNWTVLQAPVSRPGGDFMIDDWSLATGLTPEQLVAGEDFFIYIRFLDGAGNPTDSFITVPVSSSNLDPIDVYAPAIQK